MLTRSPLLTIAVLAIVLTVLVAVNPFGRNLAAPPHTEESTKL
jgi:hypothetical protein